MTSESVQRSKESIWHAWQRLDKVEAGTAYDWLTTFHHPNCRWLISHPHNEVIGIDALAESFWQPFLDSFPDLEKRCDIFFGGSFKGGDWVCATGYYAGTFSTDWVGIPATGEEMLIRFGEFCRVEEGRVVEGRLILDMIDVMRRAGFEVLSPSSGEERFVPGPAGIDGLLLGPQEDEEGRKSLKLVEDMIFKGLMTYDQAELSSMGNGRFWHEEMLWFGPGGIGTTYGVDGFEQDHQKPFLHAFPDRKGGNHDARFGEGLFVASTGWPSLSATHAGEYLGAPATNRRIGMRVMDFWRREEDLLLENWIFIDMPHLFLQFGIDLFERMRLARPTG